MTGYDFKKLKIRYDPIALCLTVICGLSVSCNIREDTLDCEHNVLLEYRYNRENTSRGNLLPEYIYDIEEYIFDANGLPVTTNILTVSSHLNEYVSKLDLPEGKYTVVAWGNKASQSRVEGLSGGSPDDRRLLLDAPATGTDGNPAEQDNSERLFYGYRSFSVEKDGVSNVSVDMSHSHCALDITVRWKKRPELDTDMMRFRLRQIPSGYGFLPGFVCRSGVMSDYPGQEKETYPTDDSQVQQYIPVVHSSGEALANHRLDVRIPTVGTRVNGQFITYRYRDDSHPLLSLYAGETLVMREIDLYRFFREMNIEFDRNMRQEFRILVEIDGDKITVGLVEAGDWEEGGPLGR